MILQTESVILQNCKLSRWSFKIATNWVGDPWTNWVGDWTNKLNKLNKLNNKLNKQIEQTNNKLNKQIEQIEQTESVILQNCKASLRRPRFNIFTAKIFGIILNGKTLLYSGLSWIFWLRSDGLRKASKIMSRTFWSTTQSNNAQSTEGTQKERENRAQMQSWKQIQF